MGMSWQAQMLCPGAATGRVLRLDAPISFWGGVDPVSSRITAAPHPQNGVEITDTILVAPRLIGSSSSSAVLLELIYQKRAPRALILGARDAILPIGALVARDMGWAEVPVAWLEHPPFQTGTQLVLEASGRIERRDTQ